MSSTLCAHIDGYELTAQPGSNVLLTPSQRKVADNLLTGMSAANVCLLRAESGMGKTTVLRHLQAQLGACIVTATHVPKLLKRRPPAAIEEAFMEMLEEAIDGHDIVIVDDLHLLMKVFKSYKYPRPNVINVVIAAVLHEADARRKQLLFAWSGGSAPSPIRRRALSWEMDGFEPQDYACICRQYLGAAAADALDFDKVHRFAPALTAYQLKNACLWLRSRSRDTDTDSFIDYLNSHNLISNVEIEEVQTVNWSDLKGMENVVEEIEAKIALPFENHALATELQLKPKRGVLLAGPPGTGKTTIGRALAHRLKGKFFLIDGRVNAADSNFYDRVSKVFEAAKRNAPAVIFIDDADVIFDSGNPGLCRYLLTMMDGLESAFAERVCVMITAMDTTALPPALLRSGRIELWLYTRVPDLHAREAIWREKLGTLGPPLCRADVEILAHASGSLSGADLKSVIEEGKLLYARALTTGAATLPIENFFLRAIATCKSNRRSYGKRIPRLGTSTYGFPS